MSGLDMSGMALEANQLNYMDLFILDFLEKHEWASPNTIKVFYNDEQDTEDDHVTRQVVSNRLKRLKEHGHIDHIHPNAYAYRLLDDPRNSGRADSTDEQCGND